MECSIKMADFMEHPLTVATQISLGATTAPSYIGFGGGLENDWYAFNITTSHDSTKHSERILLICGIINLSPN